MKEKKTKIATNISSGAEKVEVVEKQVKKTGKTTAEKIEKENKAAQARVKAALEKKKQKEQAAQKSIKAKNAKVALRAKEKEQRLQAKKALQEKRQAERKALQEKRLAERKALQEKRKAAQEEKQRQRAHAKANRHQRRAHAKAEKEQRKQQRRSAGRQSNGGWIAAVVTLGVTTLALSTVVAIGAMEMREAKAGMGAGYKSTAYELMGIMEHVDDDLDRVRIAVTPEQQSRILTDLLVQTRMAELDIEKLPISAQDDENVTTFINRAAMHFERMLSKLRNGERLDERDQALLQRLYEVSGKIKAELGDTVDAITDDMMTQFIKKSKGAITDTLQKLEQLTLTENRSMQEEAKSKMEGAGMQRNGETPHADTEAKLDVAQAEALCERYFADYNVAQFQCVGETVSHNVRAYNVQGYDDKGTLLFAEIDYMNGALVRFDYFEDCNEETFDFENAERIATQFLEKLGYEDMQAMRLHKNGTDADFTFVYTKDDVAFYPDTVKIKVCRTRGVVTSFDASKYLKNHKDREEPSVKLTMEQAQEKLHEGLNVQTARLAVVKTMRGERAAYEFLCDYKDNQYLIYTDAITGAEISIMNVKNVG